MFIFCSFCSLNSTAQTTAKRPHDLTIEQEIATQRLRLSRLVAGLLLAVVFVAAAPFSSAYRVWVREAVLSILTRAEYAAQCLVLVQARVLAAQAGVCAQAALLDAARKDMRNALRSSETTLPSFHALRLRLKALQAVLRDLPRHGLRLLRRLLGAGRASERGHFVPSREDRTGALRLGGDVIERPPDKVVLRSKESMSLPPDIGREALAGAPMARFKIP